ncbi:MAG: hypothetical protein J7521_23015 [Caulobacter sp.]|nr:hypothetical protein [Caulobacter sp.]
MPDTQTFRVHVRGDASHGHAIDAVSFEDAAVAFVERWSPAADADDEVSVIVREAATGVEHCFRIDLDNGEAASCR